MKYPVVIGAMGGSGTRIVAKIVQHAGYFMGTNLNISEDAMDFVDFFDHWINRFARTDINEAQMQDEFATCVAKHRSPIGNGNMDWGWKEPRSIYLLPFFHKYFPRMKFIHVIRDGRDMAFSSNQNQLRKHGEVMLESKYVSYQQPIQTAMLWNKVNLIASKYGETYMKEHYLRIRYEDLCRDTETTINIIYSFLDPCKRTNAHAALKQVKPSQSIGRWRSCHDSKLIFGIQSYAKEALVRFRYF